MVGVEAGGGADAARPEETDGVRLDHRSRVPDDMAIDGRGDCDEAGVSVTDRVATLTVDCGDTVETLHAPLLILVEVTFQGQPVLKIVDTDGDEVVSLGDSTFVTDDSRLACNVLGRSTSTTAIADVSTGADGSLQVGFEPGTQWAGATVDSGNGLLHRVTLTAAAGSGAFTSTASNTGDWDGPSRAGGPPCSGGGTVALSGAAI